MKKGQIGVVIAIVVVLIFIFVGFIVLSTWQVPYVIKEEYPVQEPHSETVNLKYEVINSYTGSCSELFNYVLCKYIEIENIDAEGGTFKVNCEFKTLQRTLSDSDSTYIAPGKIEKLICKGDVDLFEDTKTDYSIIPGTKTIIVYKTVMKEKDVTKYCSAFDKLLGEC